MSDKPKEIPEDDSIQQFFYGQPSGYKNMPNRQPQQMDAQRETFLRSLGEVPPLCPDCGRMCAPHTLRVRDALLERAGFLAEQIAEGVDLYTGLREYGTYYPEELIASIYNFWWDLGMLYSVIEPQAVGECIPG